MRSFLAAVLLLFAPMVGAQTITTVNENLATSTNTLLIDTNSNRLDVGTASYTGSVPGAVLFVGSNVVVSTGTGGSANVVIYATGTIMLGGAQVSTTNPAGTYVPYSGATANVNLGAKTLTTTGNIQGGQIGAGTAPSSNFYYDGLSASGAGYVRIGAGANQATGYYWGGTRGYSMQERYDLTGTPFTLHDELNNVDRFYLDTSGEWYFLNGVTVDSFTSLGAVKGGSFLGVSGATETVTVALSGVGTAANPIGVNSSSVAVLSSSLVLNNQIDHSSVPFLSSGLINNYQIDHASVPFLVSSLINNSQVDGSSVTKGGVLAGSATLSVTAGTSKTTFNTVGITSNTTAGNYLDKIHITNGVIDGGVFAAAGGSGSSNVAKSTVSISSNTADYSDAGLTTLATCITKSTVSLTVGASTDVVHFSFTGVYNNTNGSGEERAETVLVDGAYLTGFGSTTGFTYPYDVVGGGRIKADFSVYVTGISAGNHNFCVATASIAGVNGGFMRAPYRFTVEVPSQ